MPPESFDAYRLASARGYADDNVASGRWPAEAAFERAIEDFDQGLPQGLDTPDNHIYEIRDAALDETVGVIWFAVIQKNGIRSAFVYDVEVAAPHQRKGHAREAFRQLEPIVQGMGLQSIGLHVFSQNAGAQALYRSLGYQVTSVNMLKHLPTR
jgi:ribosomal protein S18 acetylase RimI-like enzyme